MEVLNVGDGWLWQHSPSFSAQVRLWFISLNLSFNLDMLIVICVTCIGHWLFDIFWFVICIGLKVSVNLMQALPLKKKIIFIFLKLNI